MWPQNASRPAAAASYNNAGYRPSNPSMPRGPPPPAMNRARAASAASAAGSDVFSLTDAMTWPQPPRTPTASPDRR